MKKFLGVLAILILLGGAAFFFGWAQLQVPAGSLGIIRSKTHGIDPRPVREGEFRWIWYKLIPTNVTIEVYSPQRITRAFNSSGFLPSGDTYAALAGVKENFSWEIAGEFSFSVKSAAFPGLAAGGYIAGDDGLKAYEESLGGRVEAALLKEIGSYGRDQGAVEALITGGSAAELETRVIREFQEIEDLAVTIHTLRYPDFALYNSAKELYGEYLNRRRPTLEGDADREAENRVKSRLRFDELAAYGELLTKYPILLQYMAMERGLPPEAPDPPRE
ncbi:MAG: hypothetical protein LBL43_00075 [Treponema sp.]|jgi:hypothetical protein|nr:hypothetical protein [Treponema sp.]